MFEHGVDGADVSGVGEKEACEAVEAFSVLESEAVAVLADAFAFAVSHVSADDGHDAHLGAGEVAFGGDVVGPPVFVGVFRSDGEDEFGFGVVRCDGACGYRVDFFDGFGEGESEGAVVHLAGDEGCLVICAGDRFDIGECAKSFADRCDALFGAFDLCEGVDGQRSISQV